jgi:hypothetical protein
MLREIFRIVDNCELKNKKRVFFLKGFRDKEVFEDDSKVMVGAGAQIHLFIYTCIFKLLVRIGDS